MMKIIGIFRFLVIMLTFAVLLILSLPVMFVAWLIGKKNPKLSDAIGFGVIQFITRAALWETGAKVTIIGRERIPADTAVLYVGNHRSYFDAILSYSLCPSVTGFVAKNSIAKIPIANLWMKRLHCLFLNREDIREGLKMILAGIENIKSGISMCIFPEGTRCKEPAPNMLPFKEGSLKMASKTGCPVIPMAITNSDDIYEKHRPFVKSARVIIEYGEPIYLNQLDKEVKKFPGAYTQEKIREMLAAHQTMLAENK